MKNLFLTALLFLVGIVGSMGETILQEASLSKQLQSASSIINSGTSGDCSWSLDADYTLTITGNGSLGNYAPWGNEIKKLIVRDGVTIIGYANFQNCSQLTSVELPSSLLLIGSKAFEGCTALENIVLPNGVDALPDNVFHGCTKLRNVTLPPSLGALYGKVFLGCSSLESINIPASVKRIDDFVFGNCKRLEAINVDPENTKFSSIDGVLYSKDRTSLIMYPEGKTDVSFTILASVTSVPTKYNLDIEDGQLLASLFHNKFLKSINVESGNTMFESLDGVLYSKGMDVLVRYPEGKTDVSFTLPSSVKQLNSQYYSDLYDFGSCFVGCDYLKSINVESDSQYFKSIDGVLYKLQNGDELLLVRFPTGRQGTCNVVEGCIALLKGAFMDCGRLESISLPQSMQGIISPFWGCVNLSEINCHGRVTSDIDFNGTKFETGTLRVQSSDLDWYQNAIGWKNWGNIVSVIDGGEYGPDMVWHLYEDNTLEIIGNGSVGNSGPWAEYASQIQKIVFDGVTDISEYAFRDYGALQSMTGISSCTSIGNCAFYECLSLSSVGDLPACISIGNSAFNGCKSLSNIGNLPACISIGNNAFFRCNSLCRVGDLPACTSIGYSAFYGCYSLSSLGDLPACTGIGNNAFSGTKSLRKIKLTQFATASDNVCDVYTAVLVPQTLLEQYKTAENWKDIAERIIAKEIPNEYDITITSTPATGSALQNAIGEENLANVLSLKVTGEINAYDFFVMRNKMPNLHELDLTDAVIKKTEDGYKYYGSLTTQDDVFPAVAFSKQAKLMKVKLPNSVTSIGGRAFEDCSNLAEVIMHEGIKTIGESAFYLCRELSSASIPEGVEVIGQQAFMYCSKLENLCFPSTLKSIGNHAFYGCNGFENIVFPPTLECIYDNAFGYCSSLKSITLPSALKRIDYGAFQNCGNLNTLKISAIDPTTIAIREDTFDNYAIKTLYIPIDEETGWDATYNAYYWHTQWGQFGTLAKWSPTYENINIGGDYEQETGTIPGVSIDATFGEESGYILGEHANQGLHLGQIKHDGNKGGSIIADDNLTMDQLVSEITVQANKWYFFCFPFDVVLADVEAPGQYVFRLYDGNERANGNSGWKNLSKSDSYLKAGKGYIFQTNTAGVLKIPVNNPNFNADNKNAQLATNNAANKQDASWNFIGNPYLSYYELSDLGHSAPITYWDGTKYVAVRPGDDEYTLQPYQAFFVQKTESSSEVEFDKDARETYNQSQKKAGKLKSMASAKLVTPERLLLNVVISDGENTDKTRVVFNDKQQLDYETECDASKFMSNESVPQIYTVHNGVKYAINERPNAGGDVNVAYKVAKAGTYTISMARMDTPMLLLDTEEGTTFDLQMGEYSFVSKAGENQDRFKLIKNEEATAVKPVTVGDAESATYFRVNAIKAAKSAKGLMIEKNGKSVKTVVVK